MRSITVTILLVLFVEAQAKDSQTVGKSKQSLAKGRREKGKAVMEDTEDKAKKDFKMDESVNELVTKLVSKLSSRVLKAKDAASAKLDQSTLAKPGTLSIPQHAASSTANAHFPVSTFPLGGRVRPIPHAVANRVQSTVPKMNHGVGMKPGPRKSSPISPVTDTGAPKHLGAESFPELFDDTICYVPEPVLLPAHELFMLMHDSPETQPEPRSSVGGGKGIGGARKSKDSRNQMPDTVRSHRPLLIDIVSLPDLLSLTQSASKRPVHSSKGKGILSKFLKQKRPEDKPAGLPASPYHKQAASMSPAAEAAAPEMAAAAATGPGAVQAAATAAAGSAKGATAA